MHDVIERFRLRGYTLHVVSTEAEALRVFSKVSPELVLADYELGRSDGAALILALRQVMGVEELPVLLIDNSRRESRREAARQVGAAAYLIHPVDVGRIADRLTNLIANPRRRRYTRYDRRLPVRVHGTERPCLVTKLGRGGMFLTTHANLSAHTVQRCEISLPEVDERISVDAEVLYRRGSTAGQRGGVGLRFHQFDNQDEATLIDYLGHIRRPGATV